MSNVTQSEHRGYTAPVVTITDSPRYNTLALECIDTNDIDLTLLMFIQTAIKCHEEDGGSREGRDAALRYILTKYPINTP